MEKTRSNYCDYFQPGYDLFDPAPIAAENRAKNSLDSLFGAGGDDAGDQSDSDGLSDAEDLFR